MTTNRPPPRDQAGADKRPDRPAKRDLYQETTDRIVELLDRGELPPWRQPIKRRDGDATPTSLATGKAYRGINVFLLAMTAWAAGYDSTSWATFNQVKKLGGSVRKGERATTVLFWKTHETTDSQTGDKTTVPVLRHYAVFNVEQCDGLEHHVVTDVSAAPFDPIAEAEKIVTGFPRPPTIRHIGSAAAYLAREDEVRIAEPGRFKTPESYYATLFHELVHAVGHKSRLDRGLGDKPIVFGSAAYGREELVAEMGSAFLCAHAGIGPPTVEQAAAYIDGWRRQLVADKRLVIRAAGQAQRAADYIRNVTFDAPAPTAT